MLSGQPAGFRDRPIDNFLKTTLLEYIEYMMTLVYFHISHRHTSYSLRYSMSVFPLRSFFFPFGPGKISEVGYTLLFLVYNASPEIYFLGFPDILVTLGEATGKSIK